MKVVVSMVLEKSPEEVWEIFDNTENLKLWQPSLVSFEHISGEPGQINAVSKLTYEEDGRQIELEETIIGRNRPVGFSGVYEADTVRNVISNRFADLGEGRTRWELETEFQFRGLYRLVAPFMSGSIRKRTEEDMQRFKKLVEAE